MTSPADLVTSVFSQAQTYVDENTSQMEAFTAKLNDAIFTAPTIDATWTAIDGPSATTMPDIPAAMTEVEAELTWDTSIDAEKPSALTISAPDIAIDSFTDTVPVLDTAPTLDFGTEPTLDFGTAPTAPTLDVVTVPTDAPTVTIPDVPTYLALSTPTFGGVDLHTDFLTKLNDVPTLSLVAPTPYTYNVSEEFKSTTLATVMQGLMARWQQGGTGLPTAVEEAIWNRARDREAKIAQAAIDDIDRQGENLGFPIPVGTTTALRLLRQQEFYDKVSGASRDISIKQAEMEQENIKHALDKCVELEGQLMTYAVNMERLSFDNAAKIADNAIAIYNAQVEYLRALVAAYQVYATAYDTLLKGEQLKLDTYRAELQAEMNKAETNRVLVEQYRVQVQAQEALISMFTARVNAARAQVEVNVARVQAYGQSVQAYVAGVNGETAKVEAYKVGVQAQGEKMRAYEVGVDAQVKFFGAKTDAFRAKVGAQGESARAQLAYYTGTVQAKTAEWQGWSARVGGEAERFRALTAKQGAILNAYVAETQAIVAKTQQDTMRWEVAVKQYEAQAEFSLNVQKVNADVIQATRAVQLDAAKAGAQVFSQLTAASMGLLHVQAGVSGSASDNVSYNYSVGYSYGGDVGTATGDVAPVEFTPVTAV